MDSSSVCACVCVRVCMSVSICTQDVFTALTFDGLIYILLDLIIEETHTNTYAKVTLTHTPQTKERKTCSARKQVDDQTGLTEAL